MDETGLLDMLAQSPDRRARRHWTALEGRTVGACRADGLKRRV